MKSHATTTVLAAALICACAGGTAQAAEPFGDAELYFELNDTDGDLGLHALIDGEEWKLLEIKDPYGRDLLTVMPEGRLARFGMTELTFESAEPDFDDLPPQDFFKLFPAGRYKITGMTVGGEELKSIVFVSQVMPAPADHIRISGKKSAGGLRCRAASGEQASRHQLGAGDWFAPGYRPVRAGDRAEVRGRD